jgi:hypothetical protein
LPALRAFLVRRGGFSSRKDAESQRNCDRLGLTSGDLAGFAREILFIYSRKGAESQRNCGPSKKESPLPPYKGELTLVLPSKI